MVPTFTTTNERICLLMRNGQMGSLRIEDAERLQVTMQFCCPGMLATVDSGSCCHAAKLYRGASKSVYSCVMARIPCRVYSIDSHQLHMSTLLVLVSWLNIAQLQLKRNLFMEKDKHLC